MKYRRRPCFFYQHHDLSPHLRRRDSTDRAALLPTRTLHPVRTLLPARTRPHDRYLRLPIGIMGDSASSAAVSHFSYLPQVAVLEQAMKLCTDDDGRIDMSAYIGLAYTSVGLRERFSRLTPDAHDFTNSTGDEILHTLARLMRRERFTAHSLPACEMIHGVTFNGSEGSPAYALISPDPNDQPARRALIDSLFRPAEDPACLRVLPGRSVEEEIDYASGQRGHIVGHAMLIALLCPYLTHLAFKIERTTGGVAAPLDSFQLLAKVFAADGARDTMHWPRLRDLALSKDDETDTELAVPPSVEKLSVYGATAGCISIALPRASTRAFPCSQLQHVTLAAHSVTAAGEASTLARKLIELGTVPQLASIEIIEYTLDANAAKALIAACKVHLPRLAKLVLDLAYRDSDYFNEAGENDHLMNLPHLGPELFVAFPHLAHLAITRFLIGDLLHIPAYLRPHLQRFRVLDGFGEELEELADRGTIHVPTSWAGCFSYGIDYEVPDVSTLRTLAEQSFDAAIQAMRHNVAAESAAKFNVELRATGNLGQPFTTVNYFEEDAGH
jgi:hypothetical protein